MRVLQDAKAMRMRILDESGQAGLVKGSGDVRFSSFYTYQSDNMSHVLVCSLLI